MLWEEYWDHRGSPWEFDPGPNASGAWAKVFSETPNYRALGVAWSGKEEFRWHFGPMFYRGRLDDGDAKILIVGQEGAQDESLSHRSFTGGTGGRMQNVLTHLGITRSYLFLNTFVYPIFGQYDDGLRPLAQDPRSPIVKHRHAILDLAAHQHDLRLVIAVGTAAKESIATWIRSHGGQADPKQLHQADAKKVKPGLRAIGVLHPGGAAMGGSGPIVADFKTALGRIEGWIASDNGWLPEDAGGQRRPASAFTYRNAPIPFRDFPFGTPWRLGFGTTSSNRRDGQKAIQLFSADGKYNNTGTTLTYPQVAGSNDGYSAPSGDLPYEPPKHDFGEFDHGPSAAMAKLLLGGKPGFPWPDFAALGLPGHPSFGYGPIARGRFTGASILVLADQASHDDLFLARALTGEAGQRLQGFLDAAGLDRRYAVLRTLPVDSLGASATTVRNAADAPEVRALLREVIRQTAPKVVLATGTQASRIADAVSPAGVPTVAMKGWGSPGALTDWKRALTDLSALGYPRDHAATFAWDGGRLQIGRRDLPYGVLRWQGSSGDRAARAKKGTAASRDYFKITMPDWAFNQQPTALSAAEQQAIADLQT